MKFNLLTVLREDVGVNRFGHKLWLCQCDCGATTLTEATMVRNGETKSCGCQKAKGNQRTHGLTRSKVYAAWKNMRNRCESPKNIQWHDYGGRGIVVDDRWLVFENFYADMGDPPHGFSLDRIDNDGNYTKENCRWADKSTQRRNQRGGVIWLTIKGERMILTDAVKKYGVVPFQTANVRIWQGWDPVKAVLTPYTRNFKHVQGCGKRYEWNGKSLTVAEWEKETGIPRLTIMKRIQAGIPLEQALTVKGFLGYRRDLRKTVTP